MYVYLWAGLAATIHTPAARHKPQHTTATTTHGSKAGEGSTGTTYTSALQHVRRHRPRLILLENVDGVLDHEESIKQDFIECNYSICFLKICPSMFGYPVTRSRVYIVGCPTTWCGEATYTWSLMCHTLLVYYLLSYYLQTQLMALLILSCQPVAHHPPGRAQR